MRELVRLKFDFERNYIKENADIQKIGDCFSGTLYESIGYLNNLEEFYINLN